MEEYRSVIMVFLGASLALISILFKWWLEDRKEKKEWQEKIENVPLPWFCKYHKESTKDMVPWYQTLPDKYKKDKEYISIMNMPVFNFTVPVEKRKKRTTE